MVDVDDEVADLEVAEVGEETRAPRPDRAAARSRLTLFVEDVGLGEDLQPRSGRRKPSRESPVVTSTAAPRVTSAASIGQRDDVVLAQHLDGALGAAARGGDEQDASRRASCARRRSCTQSGMRPWYCGAALRRDVANAVGRPRAVDEIERVDARGAAERPATASHEATECLGRRRRPACAVRPRGSWPAATPRSARPDRAHRRLRRG